MTDKELKKLSRLELLELLLAESRENERLREELEKIKQENTIEKSAQHLSETSENLGETTEKLGAALQQVSLIINSLNNVQISNVTAGNDSSSDKSEEFDSAEEIQEEQTFTEKTEPEIDIEEKADITVNETDENNGQSDISKQLDKALKLISSRIEELDHIAGIVESDSTDFTLYKGKKTTGI